MLSRCFGSTVALWGCALTALTVSAQDAPRLSLAADASLRQARQLLQQGDVANAVLQLEAHLSDGQKDAQYAGLLVDAYSRQMRCYQDEGKGAQASVIWDKIQALQGQAAVQQSTVTAAQQPAANQDSEVHAAEAAFRQGKYAEALRFFQNAEDRHEDLTPAAKQQFAYCRLHGVATRLNAANGQIGAERPQLEREVRAALTLAPGLEFGKDLLNRLQMRPQRITTTIRHLSEKEGSWSISESAHFRAYHSDPELAAQVLEIAEQTRAAVCRKWLGHDVDWSQPCQIYVHPTADSYHRASGMPATAPGHSDYDADKNDASVIHVRRVFLRADHAHMLTAILPHEVTHVILNGQFGRRLLPRWADEGMAVLSEPYARIGMHLEPLPKAYQEGRALSLNEILTVEDYPKDRSKVASFYGQSVCLVEYLTTLHGAKEFVAFMRDANQEGDRAALQKHYGLTLQDLEAKLQHWIVSERMPTLLRPDLVGGAR